jgi:hypothetical protein
MKGGAVMLDRSPLMVDRSYEIVRKVSLSFKVSERVLFNAYREELLEIRPMF